MRKSKINEVKTALFDHIEDNRKQFEQGSVHDTIIEAKIDSIKIIIDSWTPYITDNIKKSEAYQYVSKDLQSRSKKIKWWISFIIIYFTFMSMIYLILEKLHIIK